MSFTNNHSPNTWLELLHRLAPLLPADSFARLRACPDPTSITRAEERTLANHLQQAIRDLDALHHTLTTYMPRYLLDLAPQPGEPHGEILPGSFIFADVTGFTALTGELSKHGTEGQEEMNKLMNSLFGALLEPLLTSGGDLLIFAGDAALAYFPARPNGQDARWATRTALRLVEAIAGFAHLETRYGTFSLTMSAGVERGEAFAAVVGTKRRMELLISGGPVHGAATAEAAAAPSQVFVGPNARSFLPPQEFDLQDGVVTGIAGGELGDYEPLPPARRRSRMSAIFSRRLPDLLDDLRQALRRVEQIVPFIPPDLFAQIARGEDIRQHPPVAVQFVNILGLEDMALGPAGPEQATEVFQRYFIQAQEIVTDRHGIISQVDTYAQGFMLLNPFGAPTHHEGISRLAASAALELAHLLEQVNREFHLDPPLTQRTGLTYDRIFTGEIGYRHRKEHVIAGPAVNLAARLMSKAEPGQIVLDPVTWETVREDFVADSLPPIPLKGIPEPVPRFALKGVRHGRELHLTAYPLIGRRPELALLEQKLDRASEGAGQTLTIAGSAGIGKSRLIAALAESARRRGVTVLSGTCHPFTTTTPYSPWRGLVERWFEIDEGTSLYARRQQLKRRLTQLDLAPSLPAFADLLELPAADLSPSKTTPPQAPSPAGDGLFAALQKQTIDRRDEQSWAALTERTARAEASRTGNTRPSLWKTLQERASIPQALEMAIERQSLRQPTLLIVEDVQWIDRESHEILAAVIAALPEWRLFLLTTTRPENDWPGERLALAPLPPDKEKALAALALHATHVENDLADWLSARAGGNPLFTISYCQALREANAVVIDPASGTARWSGPPPPLPITLQELLLAQVNNLAPEAREVILRGAVIGDTFPAWLVADLCADTFSANQLSAALDVAARRSIISPPPPCPEHVFNNQSLHNAIYTTLSHARRRQWHTQVGDLLAQADKPTRYARLEQIAYHYSHSDDPLKAAHFTRLAGDKARARHTDEAALSFYAQTLDVSGEKAIATEQRLAHEGRGDVHALRGELETARSAYQAALPGASNQDERRLRAKLALLAPLIGPATPGLLQKAQSTLSPSHPLHPWLDAALVWIYAERGEIEEARSLCQHVLAADRGETATLLQEALENITGGKPLRPYDDFFALFARANLRHPH